MTLQNAEAPIPERMHGLPKVPVEFVVNAKDPKGGSKGAGAGLPGVISVTLMWHTARVFSVTDEAQLMVVDVGRR